MIALGQEWTSAHLKAGALGTELEPLLRSRLMERKKQDGWKSPTGSLEIQMLTNLLSGVVLPLVAGDP